MAKNPSYSVPSSSYAPTSSDYSPRPPPSAPVGPPSTAYELTGRPPKRTSNIAMNPTSLRGSPFITYREFFDPLPLRKFTNPPLLRKIHPTVWMLFMDRPSLGSICTRWQNTSSSRFGELFSQNSTDVPVLLPCALLPKQDRVTLRNMLTNPPLYKVFYHIVSGPSSFFMF